MRKLLIYTFTVLLPALIVGVLNFSVFPDSSLIGAVMLVITGGVAGFFTYFSNDAMPVIRRYCVIVRPRTTNSKTDASLLVTPDLPSSASRTRGI